MNILKGFIAILMMPLCFCSIKENTMGKINVTLENQTHVFQKKISSNNKGIIDFIGFIVSNEKGGNNQLFKLYDDKGKFFKSFSFIMPTKKIQPYAWHPDNSLLVFRCIGKTKKWYMVISNETTNEIKYIRTGDANFKFQSKEEHISSVFSIEFNPIKNPIRKEPSLKSGTLPYDNEEFYFPVKIQGDWLQIKWGDDLLSKGWIKWQDKNQLMIELFYFS